MKSKVYTAQEMRERADNIDPRKNETESKTLLRVLTNGKKVLGSSQVSDTDCLEHAANMLRQAADIRERIDDLLLTYHSCPDERDMLNHILRGDVFR